MQEKEREKPKTPPKKKNSKTRTPKKNANRKKPKTRLEGPTSRSPTSCRAQLRRLLRHGAGRSDRQPDRRRAAEHRHQPAAQRLAGPGAATRRPTSAATSSRPRSAAARRRESADATPERSTTSRSTQATTTSTTPSTWPRYRLPYPGVACLSGVGLVPQFTAPNPVNAGEIVGFDGMESNITLNASVSFTRRRADHLRDLHVELRRRHPDRVTASRPARRELPKRPCERRGSARARRASSTPTIRRHLHGDADRHRRRRQQRERRRTRSPSSDRRPAGARARSEPAPRRSRRRAARGTERARRRRRRKGAVPAAGAGRRRGGLSHTLHIALRKSGLVVRYSVNEQVAGRFEVLLASSIARQLGHPRRRRDRPAPGHAARRS